MDLRGPLTSEDSSSCPTQPSDTADHPGLQMELGNPPTLLQPPHLQQEMAEAEIQEMSEAPQ